MEECYAVRPKEAARLPDESAYAAQRGFAAETTSRYLSAP
jgi:hypothetical protein